MNFLTRENSGFGFLKQDLNGERLREMASPLLFSILPRLACLTLVVILAYMLSQATWMLLPGESLSAGKAVSVPGHVKSRAAEKNSPTLNVSSLQRANLFGKYVKGRRVVAPVKEIPMEKLNLKLMGIFASEKNDLAGMALIAKKGGGQEIYSVGADVGGFTLKRVYRDRVVFSRDDGESVLYLVKPDKKYAVPAAVKDKPEGKASKKEHKVMVDRAAGEKLKRYREQFAANPLLLPKLLSKLANGRPVVEKGALKGVRLNHGGDRKLFDQLGLKPGDLLVRVNDISIADKGKLLKLMKTDTLSQGVRLTVLRRGVERNILISLDGS